MVAVILDMLRMHPKTYSWIDRHRCLCKFV